MTRGATIKAVTFDLWDTLVIDDSDEPKRQALGLPAKKEERRRLVFESLRRQAPISRQEARRAYDDADDAFTKAWKEESVTWSLGERISRILEALGRTLPEDETARLIEAIGRMEVDVPPDPIPGAAKALAALAGRYKLSIVSDAIVTPGARLRDLLETHGLKQYFSGFAFSDEVGRSKPHRAMFESAAQQLGVGFAEMVHVGDRDRNDIKGPQALGMKAILFTAARDADQNDTTADAVCGDHAGLPAAIEALNG